MWRFASRKRLTFVVSGCVLAIQPGTRVGRCAVVSLLGARFVGYH